MHTLKKHCEKFLSCPVIELSGEVGGNEAEAAPKLEQSADVGVQFGTNERPKFQLKRVGLRCDRVEEEGASVRR